MPREYHRKRDLTVSREPSGGTPSQQPRFVVQRHDASSLHFDLRLEVGDVLVSWAVPKGPSTDPADKRLATRTEDHPLDYAGFEGRIPAGEYGGGTVIVWDTGTYENLTEHRGDPVEMADAIERGHVTVRLHGEKISGGYALVQVRNQAKLGGRQRNWLLVKVDDEGADRRRAPTRTEPGSVLTRRTNDDL